MKNLKSLRLEDSLLSEIEALAQINKTNFNSQVEQILKDYFHNKPKPLPFIDSLPYYPIHLSNHELILIVDEFLGSISGAYNCTVKVRKDEGGKGIEFQANYFLEQKNKAVKKKRYTFSITPDWHVTNVFEHWIESNVKQDLYLTKKLETLEILSINSIIQENILHINIPELNLIFKDDIWKTLFERRYPNL